MSTARGRTTDVLDDLLAHGRTSVTTGEAAALFGVPEGQVRTRMHRMARQRRVLATARGLWVIIPPEYRTWGTLPGLQLLPSLLAHLERDYYVGWLSAAEIHGAAHQRPQALQVAVDAPVADREYGRVRIEFATRGRVTSVPRRRHPVATGQVWVTTPEATAFDLADDPASSGGLNNIATVLGDLAGDGGLIGERLVDAAAVFPLATVRRLGYLLRLVGADRLAKELLVVVEPRRRYPASLLSPSGPGAGAVDPVWRVRVNSTVEPDL